MLWALLKIKQNNLVALQVLRIMEFDTLDGS